MSKISIFGATGSVGQSTLKVIAAQQGGYDFDIQVLTAQNNVDLLAAQAREFNASHAVIGNEAHYEALKAALADTNTQVSAGEKAIEEAASIPADWMMMAIVGMAGLSPLMRAIEQGGMVALANKEPLVAAGPLVMTAVKANGATLLPIDSEHNAIFQIFEPENKGAIERLILTASGGPFRTMAQGEMAQITVAQALAHPNWEMGAKISIDSATMMNKALEVIEAKYLFDVAPEQIEVLVHPQSIIHSMVEYADGSILAQMGAADMCTPITNALGHTQTPKGGRFAKRLSTPGQRLDFKTLRSLDFEAVDGARFPFVAMAYECLASGDLSAAIAMNAANEVAVAAFLDHKIAFLDIYTLVQEQVAQAMGQTQQRAFNSLLEIQEYDNFVREKTKRAILPLDSKDSVRYN